MRLSEVLRERKEAILQEFESFAREHTHPGMAMDVEALRDHAAGILDAMARDLEQPQTEAEQERKGKGQADVNHGGARSAAEEHGLGRAHAGFTMEETFAEYRALRASVMRYYMASRSDPGAMDVQDVIRFNEAIDQALAETVTEYARAVNEYRDMFLAVLGHDLRSPLNAIQGAATFLVEESLLPERDQRLAATIAATATTMGALIDDLLEYTAAQLGARLELSRSSADAGEIATDVIREAELSQPGRQVHLRIEGDAAGEWDVSRVRQALSNLVTNAARHAQGDSPVTVTISGDESAPEVVIAVHNLGTPIPEHERGSVFQPFRRGSASRQGHPRLRGRLGLGLYIARRMAEAHGGTVEVESWAEAGTTFRLRLPRRPAPGSSASGGLSGRG